MNLKTIIPALLVLLGITLFFVYTGPEESLGANTAFRSPTLNSTTTSATVNKQILADNTGRKYALITNDSDTVIYLYPYNFGSASDASTTNMINKGIRVAANGGTYTIDYDNPYLGQLWLATTTASKLILTVEK